MLSNLKTLLDSIKSELSFSRRRTVLRPTDVDAELIDTDKFRSQAGSEVIPENEKLSRWGSLEVLEELGRGAFGVVYKAWDPILRRHVALKLFRFDQGQIEEARKLAQVNSPNIVKIFRYETHEGYPGFTMELVNGVTLADELKDRGPLGCAEAAEIVIDLCKAVSSVHSSGLLHRDIKAQNVMRDANGRIVLMDFGLGESITNKAAVHSLAGTLPYIAPELFTGAPASIVSDVYSLGVLLYYLVSGEYPLQCENISGFREAHLSRYAIPFRKRLPWMRPRFVRIVERATAADPALRYRSAEVMAAALAGWRQKRPLRNGLLFAGVLTVFIVASMSFLARRPAVPEFSLTKITNDDNGLSNEPSISADGKIVAYTSDVNGAGNLNIWVKNVEGGPARRITTGSTNESEPALSPDGKQVAYRSDRMGGAIYIRDVDGGPERLLVAFGHNPVFSPDGTEIAFWTGQSARFVSPLSKVYLVSVSGGEPRQIATQFKDARLPAWSPDGNRILLQGCGPGCQEPERDSDWWTIQRDGSNPTKTGALQDAFVQGLTLYPGPPIWHDQDIIFSARVEHETNLWQIPIVKPFLSRRRQAIRLTHLTEEGVNPSVSRQGIIVFGGLRFGADLWQVSVTGNSKSIPERLNRNIEADSMPSISEDGKRILYFRRIGNSRKMVLRAPDASEILSVDVPSGTRGVIAASGELLAYSVPGTAGQQLYLRRSPSWSPVMITADGGEALDFLDDERRLLITTNDGIAALDLTTGQKTPVLKNGGDVIDQAAVSPDGHWIAFLSVQDSDHSRIFVAPMRLSLIPEKEWHAITTDVTWYDRPRWTRDGKSIAFLSRRDNFSCLWKQILDNHMQAKTEPQMIFHMHQAQTSPMHLSRVSFNLSVSRHSVLYNAGQVQANIWMARE